MAGAAFAAVVYPHGDAMHTSTYVHLGGTVTETITGVKTFSSILKLADGSRGAPSLTFGTTTTLGLFKGSATILSAAAPGSFDVDDGTTGAYARLGVAATVGGFLGLGAPGTLDAFLARDGANVLGIRNGTTAQALGIYATYTSQTDYERVELLYSAGDSAYFLRATQGSGGGANHSLLIGTAGAGDLIFWTDSTTRWRVLGADGTLEPNSDAGMNLGEATKRVGIVFTSILKVGTATVASAGQIRLSKTFTVQARNDGDTGDLVILKGNQVLTDDLIVGNVSGVTSLQTSGATSGSTTNGTWWVETTGTSPSRVCALKVRDGGSDRTIASVTY